MQRMRLAATVAILCSISQGNAAAQSAQYPTQLVKIVAPASAGSMTDLLARVLSEKLSKDWQQQVIVENRPGIAGMNSVAKAPPDGYTIMVVGNGLAALNRISENLPFNPQNDFSGISKIATMPMVLVVPTSSPATSLTEFLELARSQSGKLNYASAGLGSSAYLAAEMLKHIGKFDMTHVPYKGTPDALTSIIRGDTAMFFTPAISGVELIQQGNVRGLAVAGPSRLRNLPNVPTFAEAGLPKFDYDAWVVLVAPANTPQPILRKLSADIAAAITPSEVQELFLQQGVIPQSSRPDDVTTLLRGDGDKYQTLLPARKN